MTGVPLVRRCKEFGHPVPGDSLERSIPTVHVPTMTTHDGLERVHQMRPHARRAGTIGAMTPWSAAPAKIDRADAR